MEENIYSKMLKITKKIATVNKNLEVGKGESKYKAVGEADVLAAVKELEPKHGIYSYPYSRAIVNSEIIQSEKVYQGKLTKGNQIFIRVMTVYRFVNIDKPDEFIDITSYGDGVDTQDKAPGKAMTYADKYALMKAYKIITGDDPDQEHSPDNATYTGTGTNTGKITPKQVESTGKITPKQVERLNNVYKGAKLTQLLDNNGIGTLEDMTMEKASELIKILDEKGRY